MPVIPLDQLAAMLRPGDVICHIYQNRGEHTCLDAQGRVLSGLLEATGLSEGFIGAI